MKFANYSGAWLGAGLTVVLALAACGGSNDQFAGFGGEGTPPNLTLTAEPTTVAPGASSTLTWSSTDATSCTASDGLTGAQATSGSVDVQPSSTTSYTLVCIGPGGSASSTVTIGIAAAAANALDTPEKVLSRAMLGDLHDLAVAFATGNASTKAARRSKAAAVSVPAKSTTYDCDSGTETDDDPTLIDVNSPYTTESFVGTYIHFDHCKSKQRDGSLLMYDGLQLYACPQSTTTDGLSCRYKDDGDEQTLVKYSESGASGVPLIITESTVDNGVESIQRETQYLGGPSNRLYTASVDGVFGRFRYEILHFVHNITRLPIDGVLQLQADYSDGTRDSPSRVLETSYEDGTDTYEHDGVESFRAVDCDLGSYTVHMIEPVHYTTDPATATPLHIVGGVVEIQQDDQTARLSFNEDGSLTVVDSTSKTTNYSTPESLQAALGECAKYF
ncbi:hypothetical protein [Solimonas terrae]|uniref:Uncharacterized protein n=1 Tax=Solimonas terrae TaxID=1396819 RepID=A0A6M2BTA0_9GAMM|nr:hypothetical protein [Solimonas terrae]NGY05333.1 hypothetical protein [Solimonas terrae]